MSTVQFLKFSLFGAIGFVVDATTLYVATAYFEQNLYTGRLISYLFAATCTWLLNRRHTFSPTHRTHPLKEWLSFLTCNSLGGAINFGTYSYLVSHNNPLISNPTFAVAVGSVFGLAFNFSTSKNWVFRDGITPKK
jgi:putative flippase GtrA